MISDAPRGTRRRWQAIGLLAPLAAILCSGCGYSSDPLYRQTVRSVYVDMAQSKEFRRGIEFELTEAIRKQLDLETPYKNAPREKADTILSAEVLEWRESTIGREFGTHLPRETAATLVIRYRWQDMRSGRLIRNRPRFVTTVNYVRPVGETVADARLDAANKHARNIVHDLQSSW